jgi:hypothetical protein
VFGLFAAYGGLLIIAVYVALCLSGIIWFRQTHGGYNPVVHGLIPAIGAVIFALGIYGSVWPVPAMPYRTVPYLDLVWALIGIGVLASLRSRHPERVEAIGSILGEEGGEEAAALDEGAAAPEPAQPVRHEHPSA